MTVRNIEDQEVKLSSKQVAIYIAGICFAAFTVAGAYFGLKDDNNNIKSEMHSLSEKLDRQNQQYIGLRVELARKEDKK